MPDAFSLPRDGAIYTKTIFERCKDFIAYNVWSGIEAHRLDIWIENFKTPEERYFAARVLDALIYRSDAQTVALAKQLFQRTIPDLARQGNLPRPLLNSYELFKAKVDPFIRIVPVIPPNDPPTKSGVLIGRSLRRRLNFQNSWIAHPREVPGLVARNCAIIFIDDFLGTGTQFTEFVEETGLDALLASGSFLYTPLAGHVSGIESLRAQYPYLAVDVVEALDSSHALFDENSGSFPDELNSTEVAREFYYDLLADRGIHISGPNRRGFGHFELVYAFEHAVPDNSLPLLWWGDSDNWNPLFDR